MVGELLTSADAAARQSKPDVRAAALLRIARVQIALDRNQARQTFEQALDEIRRIPGRDGAYLLEHARLCAAAVAPDLLPSIPSAEHDWLRHLEGENLGWTMIEHGNLEAAREFVMRHDDAATFPFPVAGMLIDKVDTQDRLALLRRAVAAWREARDDRFVWLFQYRWKLLLEQEAREIVREFVGVALAAADKPMQATYDREGTIRITSFREHTLFQVLHILRRLDEPLLESLIGSHSQLAAAARRFPNGMESAIEEAEERRKSEGSSGGGFVMGGSSGDFPYLTSLMQGSQDGDFEQAMEHARQQYRSDAGPEDRNLVPAEFWPSANRFRSILYAAGKRLGAEASRYLARIDDPDLRLFAQIELAAALAGIPEFRGVQREHRPRPRATVLPIPVPSQGAEVLSPRRKTIRCPKCNWVPQRDHRWQCKCGHSWNTFETGGACPACSYQWSVTACLWCGETSAHSDWYLRR